MVKRIYLVIITAFLLFPVSVSASESSAVISEDTLASQAKAAYLMEAQTQKKIYAKKAEERMYPASMTKMMGLLLVYEQINDGALKLDDRVCASETAASMGGSQIYLKVNEEMTVEDLLKSVCIASANDAMVALAEKVGGTHEQFVLMMNEKAKELKLCNTHFVNATGLHDDDHYSCAKDMATIAAALIKEGGEELLSITSTYDSYIREDSDQKFWLVNTNKLIKQLDGADGLKTGFTSEAGSCITVTAKRNGLRLIGVVMGEPDGKTRNQEASQLIEYGFSGYEFKQLYAKGDAVDELCCEKGTPVKTKLLALEDAYYVVKKGTDSKVKEKQLQLTDHELPYQAGKECARLKVTMDDGYTFEVSLGTAQDVQLASYVDLLIRSFRQMIA